MNDSEESSSINQNLKKETKLITFDKAKRITYFGSCKVEINTADKCLVLTTTTTVKGPQERTSTFNRTFIQKENALFVIDGITKKDFVILFPSKDLCDRILNAINAVKFPNGTPTNDLVTEDSLFEKNFFIPILKEILNKCTGFSELKTIILELVNTFPVDQRQAYKSKAFEILMDSDSPNDKSMINGDSDSPNGKSTNNGNNDTVTICNKEEEEVCSETDESMNDSFDANNESLNEATTSNHDCGKLSPVIYDAESESYNSSPFSTPLPKKSRSPDDEINLSLNVSKHNIFTANYEFVENHRKRKRILIFTSDKKNYCYEFYYSKSGDWHICSCCTRLKHSVSITIVSVNNGKMEFKFSKKQHICNPINYLPENYTIQEVPESCKIREEKNCIKRNEEVFFVSLILKLETFFSPQSSNYQSLNEATTSSNISRKRSHLNFIPASENDCDNTPSTKKSRLFDNEMNSTLDLRNNILTANYDFVENYHKAKRILIFTSNEKKQCYEFDYCITNDWHNCVRCNRMDHETKIKIISIKNGEMEFKFYKAQHVCEPFNYVPENYTSQELVIPESSKMKLSKKQKQTCFKSSDGKETSNTTIKNVKKIEDIPDFKILRRLYNGRIGTKLIVFDSNDKSLCYEYYKYQTKQRYRCRGCKTQFNFCVYADLISDDAIELGPNEHKCKPKKFKLVGKEYV